MCAARPAHGARRRIIEMLCLSSIVLTELHCDIDASFWYAYGGNLNAKVLMRSMFSHSVICAEGDENLCNVPWFIRKRGVYNNNNVSLVIQPTKSCHLWSKLYTNAASNEGISLFTIHQMDLSKEVSKQLGSMMSRKCGPRFCTPAYAWAGRNR